MTKTPTRTEILAKAGELYFNDMAKSGINNFNNPEPNELAESGYIQTARSTLMRDQYRSMVENKDYMENLEDFKFDFNEAMQTTTFISGSRGIGKSDIAMHIVDKLINEGIICVSFDSSLDWLKRSSISQYITVKPYSDLQIPDQNTIIDMSMLTPIEQQRTVEAFCKKLFEHQINNMTNRYYLVFEESQIYFPLNSIRAKRYQYTTRVLTVGRNVNVSVCAISQFPSLIDCELRKNAQQIYVGCTSEPNTLAYWRGILGKNADQLKDLQNGEFLYYCRNKLSRIQIEPYENHTTKTRIAIPEPIIQPIPQSKQNNTHAISTLITAFLWFIAILYAISAR